MKRRRLGPETEDLIQKARELSQGLKAAVVDEASLSTPTSAVLLLPYPSLASTVPSRIAVNKQRAAKRSFEFMGRVDFVEMLAALDDLCLEDIRLGDVRRGISPVGEALRKARYCSLQIYAELGWGKVSSSLRSWHFLQLYYSPRSQIPFIDTVCCPSAALVLYDGRFGDVVTARLLQRQVQPPSGVHS